MTMLKSILSFFFIIALSIEATAQEISEDIICTAKRVTWSGTNEDIQNIKLHPVPESFRQRVETKVCRHTAPGDLIVWHRKFGSEDTMKDALNYLEDPAIIWGLGVISQRENAKPTPKHRTEDYPIIAQYYNMGAIAFSSLDFVKSAEKYVKETKTLCDKLSPDWPDPPKRSGCRIDGDATVIEKLSREIAVTRALISREESDVTNAKSILDLAEMPNLDEYLELAFDDFELPDQDVLNFLKLQTLLATVEDQFSKTDYPDKSYDLNYDLVSLFIISEANESNNKTGLTSPNISQQRARISLALSDMHFFRAKKSLESKTSEISKFEYDIANNINLSLDHLLAAEKYTPRYSAPSQWNGIALKFVDRMKLWEQLQPDIKERRGWPNKRARQLDYFKDGLTPKK